MQIYVQINGSRTLDSVVTSYQGYTTQILLRAVAIWRSAEGEGNFVKLSRPKHEARGSVTIVL